MVEGLSSPGLCTAALLLLVSPGFPPVWKCSERERICFLARAIGEFQVNSIAPLLPDRNALQPTGDVGREQILQCGSDLLLLTLVSSCGSGCPGQGSSTHCCCGCQILFSLLRAWHCFQQMHFRGRERDEFGSPLSRAGGNESKPRSNQTIVLVTNHLCRATPRGLCPSPLCELESQAGSGVEVLREASCGMSWVEFVA